MEKMRFAVEPERLRADIINQVATCSLAARDCYKLALHMMKQTTVELSTKDLFAIVRAALEFRGHEDTDSIWVPFNFHAQDYKSEGFRNRLLEQAFIRYGMRFSHNVRASRSHVWEPTRARWGGLTKTERKALLHRCQTRMFAGGEYRKRKNGVAYFKRVEHFNFNARDLMGAIEWECQKNSYDPLVDWLNSLPRWDGEDRLTDCLDAIFDTRDTPKPLLRLAAESFFRGLVERAIQPGCVHEQIVVLVSKVGGAGKTGFFRKILPPELRYLYKSERDIFNPALKSREVAEKLTNKAILELGEFNAMPRSWLDNMKAMTSMTEIDARDSYGEFPEDKLFRHVFVATSNRPKCLQFDPSGYRRFIPIWAERPAFNEEKRDAWLDANRDQLFAQAIAKVSNKTFGKMTARLEKIHTPWAERFGYNPDELASIDDFLADYAGEFVHDWEVREHIGTDIGVLRDRSLRNKILKHPRCKSTRGDRVMVDGRRGYRFYLHPMESELENVQQIDDWGKQLDTHGLH